MAAITLPLTGEFAIPFADAVSFEFEARPKGVFLESYRRRSLTSVGGQAFLGDERRKFVTGVVAHDVGQRVALLAGVGAFHSAGVTDTRFSLGGEATLSTNLVGGVRVDHRTGQGQDPALLLYGNAHLPLGPSAFRQALRLQIDHRFQPDNHATAFALSHVTTTARFGVFARTGRRCPRGASFFALVLRSLATGISLGPSKTQG